MSGKPKDSKRAAQPRCFVVMCFDDRLKPIYYKVIKPVIEDCGYVCERADEIVKPGGVLVEQICQAIRESDLLLCDLTFDNPNVFYELGIAHTLKKPAILISQTPANIPFDVRHLRVIPYEDTKFGLLDLRSTLTFCLKHDSLHRVSTVPIVVFEPHPFVADELERQRAALISPSLDMKRYAIKFLGNHKYVRAFSEIQSIACSHTDHDVVRDAFTALHSIDSKRAYHILIEYGLRSQVFDYVRERVVNLLGQYSPDKELLNIFFDQLGDSSWGVRRAVCEVLGRSKSRNAMEHLVVRAMDDQVADVRMAAREALQRLGGVLVCDEESETDGKSSTADSVLTKN